MSIWTPPYVQTPLYVPILPCASVCCRGYLHVIWGWWPHMFVCSLYVWTPHMFGLLPHVCMPHVPLYICMCLEVSACNIGDILHMLGSGGHQQICQVFGVFQYIHCYLDGYDSSCCTFLVVHYVSSLYYHGYDCYYSGDCGVFWYVISFISYYGSLFDGASCNIGLTWFCHHCWHQGALEVLLALPLCHSSDLHIWCLFRLMQIMPWVLHR